MLSLVNDLKKSSLIAIEGEPGAGKSTLARYLKNQLNANLVSIDDFYLPLSKRDKDTFAKGGNNIDFKRLFNEVISKHINKESIEYRSYNCQTDTFSEVISLSHTPILIIEGSYVLRPEIINYFDYKILLTILQKQQAKRLSSRPNYPDFVKKWIPLSRTYIKDNDISNKVDRIIEDLNL